MTTTGERCRPSPYVDEYGVPSCRNECPHFVPRLKKDGTQRERSRWKCALMGHRVYDICEPAVRDMARALAGKKP